MSAATTVQVGQRGVITLPKHVRDACHLRPGDRLRVIDLGGVLVLSAEVSDADALSDRFAGALREKGETLESMLAALSEERDAV